MAAVDVLIFSECHWYFSFSRSAGAQRIATELRQNGFSVQVVDFFGLFNKKEIEKLIKKYVDRSTLAVGFSSTNFTGTVNECYWQNAKTSDFVKKRIAQQFLKSNGARPDTSFPFDNDVMLDIIGKMKKASPNIKVLYGGSKANNQQAKNIDCNFIAYADHLLIPYMTALKNVRDNNCDSSEAQKKSIVYDKNSDPFVFTQSRITWDKTDYLTANEVVPIEVSRGCIFRCKFCSFPLNGKSSNDYIKDSEVLYQEFLENYEKYGITSYVFSDDTFNDSTDKLRRILAVVKRLPFKLRFTTYLRIDLLYHQPEQIQLLKEMGLQFAIFGIESINNETLRSIGKGLPFEKLKETLAKLRLEWGHDILTFASFIFGLPHETPESLQFQHEWLSTEGLNYLHEIRSLPFFISRSTDANVNKSDISMDPAKYGYDFELAEGKYGWHNQHNGLYFSDMVALADKTDERIRNDVRRRYAGFAGGMLPNAGISFEEISSTPFSRLDLKLAEETYSKKVSWYKQQVLARENGPMVSKILKLVLPQW